MTEPIAERPWEDLPPAVVDVMRPELPALVDEIMGAIPQGVPEYARPLEGPFGAALRTGVEEALSQFLLLVENPGSGRGAGREVYVALGRAEMRAGRRLDALLAAYRLGARVAWRRLAAAGEAADLSPRTLYLLAEAIFAYIDELSADSIEGFASEQSAAAGALQRRRQRLAAMLVQETPASRAAVENAAAEAGWPLPAALAALAVDGEEADRLALRLGPDTLVAPVPPRSAMVLVPDPGAPGRRRELTRALRGRLAVHGPTGPWRDAGLSLRRAQAALQLARAGALGEVRRMVLTDDHDVALLLSADRRLAEDLSARALAPLDAETELSRDRLGSTLDAWLRYRGRTEEVARALHVHPQTVRYRLGRLRELFGDRLDDAEGRFELELALRVHALAPR